MKFIFLFLSMLSVNSFAEMPKWVLIPGEAGHKYAIVGSAMPQKMGVRAQYKMAEMAARKEYFANKDTYISSSQVSYTDSTGNKNYESNTYINIGGLISFSQFTKINEWTDPDSHELFLLYVIQ